MARQDTDAEAVTVASMREQTNLFEKRDKVEVALVRLREFEPPEGYFLAYSGGKDSTVLLELARRSGVKFEAHYSATTIDPPELVRFVRRQQDVVIDWPKKSFLARLAEKAMPMRRRRWCCSEYKERGGTGRLVLTGIRSVESPARGRRRMVETCMTDGTKRYLHPIIDWAESDVWEFIRGGRIPYCSLYDEGFRRLGCIMCPMGSKTSRLYEAERWPRYEAAFRSAFVRLFDRNRGNGKLAQWEDGSEMFDWWLGRIGKPNHEQGLLHFEDDKDAVGIYESDENAVAQYEVDDDE